MQINEGTKINTEVKNIEEYWYSLDYKAPLISTSINFLLSIPAFTHG